jgi:zinc transport system substrate-binding protein
MSHFFAKSHFSAKRILNRLFLFLILCSFIFTGCKKNEVNQQKTLRITATFYPLYIMLLNITDGVQGVSISMLAPPNTGCLHDYQLTTQDMRALDDCDILVANGAGMEDFLDKALASKHDRTIIAAEGYPLVDGNAHVWVSPKGAIYEVQKIASGLAVLDSIHADMYQKNCAAYVENLKALSVHMHTELDAYKGARIITFHEAFPYFAAEFGLTTAAVIEREAGTEPAAKELAELVGLIKSVQHEESGVALFAEPQYSSAAAETISAETGCTVYELDPAVTGELTKESYIQTMIANTAVLKKALAEASGKSAAVSITGSMQETKSSITTTGASVSAGAAKKAENSAPSGGAQ